MFLRSVLFLVLAAGLRAEDVLLVVLKGGNALAYYTTDGKLLATVPVGEHPHEMVLSPDNRFAYISDNGTMRIEDAGEGGNTVSVVDLKARKRVDKISLGKYRRPHGLSFDPASGRIAVTTEAPEQIIVIDSRKNGIVRNFPTEGKTSHMVSFAPNKNGSQYAFVSNSGDGTISVVQLNTGFVTKIPAGTRPEGSVASVDGKFVFVCNRESASITVLDVSRRAPIGEIKTGNGPVRAAVTPDGKTLVYALMHDKKIGFVDLDTRREVATVAVSGEPVSISVSPDGKYALSAAEDIDTVYMVSIADRKLAAQFQTEKGAAPDPVMMVSIP